MRGDYSPLKLLLLRHLLRPRLLLRLQRMLALQQDGFLPSRLDNLGLYFLATDGARLSMREGVTQRRADAPCRAQRRWELGSFRIVIPAKEQYWLRVLTGEVIALEPPGR